LSFGSDFRIVSLAHTQPMDVTWVFTSESR
jgi:hypothetical protein